jgi:REP element-mobilizing transposase RayT
MSPKFRKSLRLPNFDYSQDGAYFITIVTQNRACLFGDIINEEMILNDAGRMIEQIYLEIPRVMTGINVDTYQVMPNHFHCIILIEHDVGAGPRACPQPLISLPDIIGRFKSLTTHRYIDGVKMNKWQRFDKRLWQRNYYEHVVRNEIEHQAIADYIFCNPQNWEKDSEYPH